MVPKRDKNKEKERCMRSKYFSYNEKGKNIIFQRRVRGIQVFGTKYRPHFWIYVGHFLLLGGRVSNLEMLLCQPRAPSIPLLFQKARHQFPTFLFSINSFQAWIQKISYQQSWACCTEERKSISFFGCSTMQTQVFKSTIAL